ncbi:MAG: Hsp20/alpha crystallin family protein [Hyphomicrobiales bacterium]
MNIYENKEEFRLELAIPGYKKSEIEINLDQKILKISSKEEKDKKNSKETIICRKVQFSKQAFSRSLQLPESINLKAINAIIEDGLLKIFLPKNKETEMKQTRQIFIS